ncbi:MAG TPA: FtsX-like permease family protein [Blastocatellia bacterium]|nr:FtsX-like permease family protein [Blastocatellia bacterium]
MKFVVNLAWREMRASWRRLLFFFICIAIGVGSIVALRSLVQNVKAAVGRESRSLLTADVQISSGRAWNAETRGALDRYYKSPLVEAHTETFETATMLRSVSNENTPPKMVELKAVQAQFPFYGEIVLAGGAKYSHSLVKKRGVLIKQNLMGALDMKIGDLVRIGDLDFTIRGVIEAEPGSAMNVFSFGPRVIVDYDDAAAAGLNKWGSRARYRALFKTREGAMEQLFEGLQRDLRKQPHVAVRSFRQSQDRMGESLTQVEDYLSLIGLVILVLGGIGVSSVTRVFVQQKMKTIAILKCLGGRNAPVLGAYLAQILALGLLGSLMGLLIAKVVMTFLPEVFAGAIPFNVEFGLTWQAALQGIGVGTLISLLFSMTPLLEIRRIKPILVLRGLTTVSRVGGAWPGRWKSAWRNLDWMKLVSGLIVLLGLVALASWQAGSLKIGGIFLGALAAMTLVLNLMAAALMTFVRGFRRFPSFSVRQGVRSLYRPGNQTRTILIAVGLGVFFVVAVRSLQLNLREEFAVDMNTLRADMYMIEIQPDQRDGIQEITAKYIGSKPELIPTVSARLAGISTNADIDNVKTVENRGMMGREYIMTYRDHIEDSEKVLVGEFWNSRLPPDAEPEVSIEELLHKELGLNVGDTMTFNVQGRPITARVANIRRVDWRNARTGFLVVFRPGPLDRAPAKYISAIKGPPDSAARAHLQRDLLDKYPNVSVVDVRDIIEIARGIVQNISLAVSFVGGFVFLSGLLILIGSIAMTKFHRLYESAILKTLGAKRKLIIATLLVEYGALGLLAGALGSSAAIALTWAVSEHVLKIEWRFMPSVNMLGVVVAAALVMAVGVLSSWDVMVKKPLGILRAE